MKNMFSGNQEKKIPKNLKECYKTDGITQNLWLWCERLEKLGAVLFWIILISGIIIAITSSYSVTVEETTHGTYYTWTETETITNFDWDVFLVSIVETALYAFIEYCIYHVLALLIASLASIVQHTKITANISLYTSAKAEGVTDDFDEPVEEKDETIKTDEKTFQQIINNKTPSGLKQCRYCKKTSPVETERCSCGCLEFITLYDEN